MELSEQFAPVYSTQHGSARVSSDGYVHNVAVNYWSRGQGHGTELMQKITSDADRLGKPLVLHAREDLHPWYGRLGFTPTGEDGLGHVLERTPRA